MLKHVAARLKSCPVTKRKTERVFPQPVKSCPVTKRKTERVFLATCEVVPCYKTRVSATCEVVPFQYRLVQRFPKSLTRFVLLFVLEKLGTQRGLLLCDGEQGRIELHKRGVD